MQWFECIVIGTDSFGNAAWQFPYKQTVYAKTDEVFGMSIIKVYNPANGARYTFFKEAAGDALLALRMNGRLVPAPPGIESAWGALSNNEVLI